MSDGLFKTDDPAFEAVMLRALRDALHACEAERIPVLGVGAIAMTAYKRGSWPVGGGDIDLMFREQDARPAQDALVEAGFRREPCSESWLLKAMRDHVLVDLIFVAGGALRPDDEMMERGHDKTVAGVEIKVISPEDYCVMQSLATKRAAAGYWFDAIQMLDEVEDWEYLLRRSSQNPARMLALLTFAIADGSKAVPEWVLGRLLPLAEERARENKRDPKEPAEPGTYNDTERAVEGDPRAVTGAA